MKVAVLFSGGKDSVFSTYWAIHQGWSVECLLTMKSKNEDSYMFHTPNIDRAKIQADAMELPLLEQDTEGIKEKELDDLEILIERAKSEYGVYGIVVGALASEYQRIRVNQVCRKLNLRVLAPIWHRNPMQYMNDIIKSGFDVRLISIAAYPLTKEHLMKQINVTFLDELAFLNKKVGLHVCGEGGEYESFVLDCPIYKKRISIDDYQVKEEGENSAKVILKELSLISKTL